MCMPGKHLEKFFPYSVRPRNEVLTSKMSKASPSVVSYGMLLTISSQLCVPRALWDKIWAEACERSMLDKDGHSGVSTSIRLSWVYRIPYLVLWRIMNAPPN